jgi:hypothetical protein
VFPDPILLTDDGDVYAGIFLCAIICVGIVGASALMISTTQFKPIKIIFHIFSFVGTLVCWGGLAMDASKYEWWKWYDGFLFPIHVLITPGYYDNGPAFLALVLPSLVLVICLLITSYGLLRLKKKKDVGLKDV